VFIMANHLEHGTGADILKRATGKANETSTPRVIVIFHYRDHAWLALYQQKGQQGRVGPTDFITFDGELPTQKDDTKLAATERALSRLQKHGKIAIANVARQVKVGNVMRTSGHAVIAYCWLLAHGKTITEAITHKLEHTACSSWVQDILTTICEEPPPERKNKTQRVYDNTAFQHEMIVFKHDHERADKKTQTSYRSSNRSPVQTNRYTPDTESTPRAGPDKETEETPHIDIE
jgi:hypothetical protein